MPSGQIINGMLRRNVTSKAFVVKNRMKTAIGRLSDEKRSYSCFMCVEQFHGVSPNEEHNPQGLTPQFNNLKPNSVNPCRG